MPHEQKTEEDKRQNNRLDAIETKVEGVQNALQQHLIDCASKSARTQATLDNLVKLSNTNATWLVRGFIVVLLAIVSLGLNQWMT